MTTNTYQINLILENQAEQVPFNNWIINLQVYFLPFSISSSSLEPNQYSSIRQSINQGIRQKKDIEYAFSQQTQLNQSTNEKKVGEYAVIDLNSITDHKKQIEIEEKPDNGR